ncbi:DUF4335 domain-containing protein [Pelatocladus sp. BLCC-F211]|uniref:DUF4335 domain-containing protein n=1 Tax=Pelatocladus sp. BLCC-F211 TaxID=3342752 RepID=UPI0035B7BDD5
MNIQRKYSLPNCTLVLEGLSDATRAAQFQELRPALSILVNAECYLSGYGQPLSGGREFFESLVRAVSAYAQEFLSSVSHPQAHNFDSELVQMQKLEYNRHRLIVHSEIPNGQILQPNYVHDGKQPVQIDLNTVQLFDLVEAVDQFFADTQTLPELSLELQPVPRRYGSGSEGLVKQVVPASVGVTSLAAAAIAFAMIPPPPPPQTTTQQQSDSTALSVTPSTPAANPEATNTPSPNANQLIATNPTSGVNAQIAATPEFTPTPTVNPQIAATPEFTPTPAVNEQIAATPEFTPTPTSTTVANSTPNSTSVVNQNLEALLTSVPEITDASQLRALNRQVYNQIHPNWKNRQGLKEDLVFRVGVAADGAIVGYKAVNPEANQAVNQTPLPNLIYNPAVRPPITNEPIAQYRVVFTRDGVLQVSPWRGYTTKPDVIGAKISDANQVKQLNQQLYDGIRQNWHGKPSYTIDLKYRVAVNKDGLITDYEPLNQVAFDYFRETPLPQMFQSSNSSNQSVSINKEPLAHFQVIFQPTGKLEITPWQGYQ